MATEFEPADEHIESLATRQDEILGPVEKYWQSIKSPEVPNPITPQISPELVSKSSSTLDQMIEDCDRAGGGSYRGFTREQLVDAFSVALDSEKAQAEKAS